MYKCKICEFITDSVSQIGNHYKSQHSDEKEFICDKCGLKFKNKGGLSCHVKKCTGIKITNGNKLCSKCNFVIANNFEKHFNYCDGKGPRRKREKQGYGWSKGLTKETDERLLKISESLKGRDGYKHTEETKELLSKLMKERYANGWESTAGRCEKLDYISPIADKIKVDGNWELRVAKYLDKIGVIWERNKKRFNYFNSITGKNATYCPDFFVKNWNCFIEVKGYKTELDDIKWKQFEYNLQIWNKQKLIELGIDVKYRKK